MWWVTPDGKVFPYPPWEGPSGTVYGDYVSEPISSVDSVADFLTNQKINRLLEEGKITIKDAESARQQTKNMDFLEKERFLSAIEHRAERERHGRDSSLESIAKKYGIDPSRFRL